MTEFRQSPMPFNTIDQRGIQFCASLFRFIEGETIARCGSPQSHPYLSIPISSSPPAAPENRQIIPGVEVHSARIAVQGIKRRRVQPSHCAKAAYISHAFERHDPEREISQFEITRGIGVISQITARQFIDGFRRRRRKRAEHGKTLAFENGVAGRMGNQKTRARVQLQIARVFGQMANEHHWHVTGSRRER